MKRYTVTATTEGRLKRTSFYKAESEEQALEKARQNDKAKGLSKATSYEIKETKHF